MHRVLHVINSPDTGGIESWLLNVLRGCKRDRFALDVCFRGNDQGPLRCDFEATGARLHHCPITLRNPLAFVRRLSNLLRREQYSILHAHVNSHAALAVAAAQIAGVPCISTAHNELSGPDNPRFQRPLIRNAYNCYSKLSTIYSDYFADEIAPVSKAVMDAVYGEKARSGRRRSVLYLGAPRPGVVSDESVRSFRASVDGIGRPLVLHVGSFTYRKNHLGLLDVFKKLLQLQPKALLILVGSGPLKYDVEARTSELELSASVRVLGVRHDVYAIMQSCDVLLFPSVQEGLPIVVMEANAVGIPVVASKIPSISEAVVHGETGLLHDLDDIDGMADSVNRILSDNVLSQALSSKGKTWFNEWFSIESSVSRLLDLYEDLLQRPSRRQNAVPPEIQ